MQREVTKARLAVGRCCGPPSLPCDNSTHRVYFVCVCVAWRGVAWGRNTLCPTCVRSEVMCCDVCMRVRTGRSRGEGAVRALSLLNLLCVVSLCVRVWTHGRYLVKED